MNINHNTISGNLTKDPQVRFLANDKVVADFTIANNRKYKDSNGQIVEETTFIDVKAWGRTAELVGQYLIKGRGCIIEGRLKSEKWDDKETGQKRSKLVLIAENVHFMPGEKRESGANSESEPPPAAAPQRPRATASQSLDDEPPF